MFVESIALTNYLKNFPSLFVILITVHVFYKKPIFLPEDQFS